MFDYMFEDYYHSQSEYQCPPKEAEVFNGELYRFSNKRNQVSVKDFQPFIERKNFRTSHEGNHELICQGGALSSYISLEDAEYNLSKIRKNSPFAKKKFKSIHKVSINHTDGKVMSTPARNTRNHYSWWCVKNKDYLALSTFVKNHPEEE